MSNTRKNTTKYQSNRRPATGQQKPVAKRRSSPKKGVVPAIQTQLRRAYIFYRTRKAALAKSGGFAKILSDRSLMTGLAIIMAFVLITTILYFAIRKNSYEVFVGGKSMGIIAMNKSVTSQYINDMAVSKLASEIGSNVQVNETVEFVPVHASKNSQFTEDYVISNIYKSFTYQIEACAIIVSGTEFALLKSRAEADELLKSLIDLYVPENANIVDPGTVEAVELVSKYVDSSEIDTMERALTKLTTQNLIEQPYTVQSGDNLWKIANDNDMKVDDIINLNPDKNLSDPTRLRAGTEIKILRPVKLISIRTVEEVKHIEVDYKKEQRVDNTDQPKSYSRVIQQGRDGQKEVTYHIIRVNGFEIEKKQVREDIITPSEPYIIEVGTK